MATFTVYNRQGENVERIRQPEIFETPVDTQLIHRYAQWVGTVLRSPLGHTKKRGEVSGGGRKPWKQKGTGRARVGSNRSPLWRGGGIIFGPSNEKNWATRMPRAERRKALFSALAGKAHDKEIIILEDWKMEAPKTKEVVALLNHLAIKPNQSVLHLHSDFDRVLFASTGNLPNVHSRTLTKLSILDLLNHDILLMTKDTLLALVKHFTI